MAIPYPDSPAARQPLGSRQVATYGAVPGGYGSDMIWTIFIILGIVAFALIILGRR